MNKLAKCYYSVKPFIPRRLQIMLRRYVAYRTRHLNMNVWPIDPGAGASPPGWQGWPEGKRFALVLTHDVDTQRGHDRCLQLMKLEQEAGVRSSFNFVAEEYAVSEEIRSHLEMGGFEVGVHGLRHNSSLFNNKDEFLRQSVRINYYLNDWGAVGFRSPCMYHNLQLMHNLNITYDASTFDTDPFEPQPDGFSTIFPFFVAGNGDGQKGYVELPYTLPQDFTLFILFKERNLEIWKRKLDWVVAHGGMALFNTHPDYMSFDGRPTAFDEYPAGLYQEFLQYIVERYHGQYWQALPKEVAELWSSRYGVRHEAGV